jgi:hypothetical protein
VSSVDPTVRLLAELDRPARPSVEFEDELLARLIGLLEDPILHEPEAQANARSHGWVTRVLRAARTRPRRTTLAFAAIAAAAAGAALFVGSPWKTSPGFLERAQAALTPPAGSVLHVRSKQTITSKVLGCTAELPTEEMWIDQTPPHRYRMLAQTAPGPPHGGDPGTNACRHGLRGEIAEFGGVLDTVSTPLMFVPPNTLTTATGTQINLPPDPVATLRQAIADSSAHDAGTSEIDGRTVRRIRIDPGCQGEPCDELSTAYVDPETFALVREEMPNSVHIAPGPGFEVFEFDMVIDYLAFEYLPRTAANLALTDIRAQHPDATDR